MVVELNEPVQYALRLDDDQYALNDHIGREIRLEFHGSIECQHCGRATNKSFSQGYCFPCFKKLAQCDLCVVSPERCHFEKGTCREPEWGESFCMQPHIVYLANSSGIKVGITRPSQVPTRWIDQGAVQAIPIFETDTRQQAGFVETVFKAHITDRTQWQKMLKSEGEHIDLIEQRDALLALVEPEIAALRDQFGQQSIRQANATGAQQIRYPVQHYPDKVKSLNFDKTPVVEGVLQGIKGQYLILDTGVINLRKFTSYEVSLSVTGNGNADSASPGPDDADGENLDLF